MAEKDEKLVRRLKEIVYGSKESIPIVNKVSGVNDDDLGLDIAEMLKKKFEELFGEDVDE